MRAPLVALLTIATSLELGTSSLLNVPTGVVTESVHNTAGRPLRCLTVPPLVTPRLLPLPVSPETRVQPHAVGVSGDKTPEVSLTPRWTPPVTR